MSFGARLGRWITIAICLGWCAACTGNLPSSSTGIGNNFGNDPSPALLVPTGAALDDPRSYRPSTGSADRLYAAQFYAPTLGNYKLPDTLNKGPACKVSGVADVNGIATDKNGILYVPIGNEHTVFRFRPNCGEQLKPLGGFASEAFDVAIDDSAGLIYVDTGIKVVVFEKGKTTPSNVLCCGSGSSFGVAVDSKHRVYETTVESPKEKGPYAFVYVFAHGNKGRKLFLHGLLYPIGITFDHNDNMIITDEEEGILIYAPPYRGQPTRTITPHGTSNYAKLGSDESTLYVSDVGNASIDAFDYRSGAYQYSITRGLGGLGYLEGLAIASTRGQHQ